jgi:hypothetical protein
METGSTKVENESRKGWIGMYNSGGPNNSPYCDIVVIIVVVVVVVVS